MLFKRNKNGIAIHESTAFEKMYIAGKLASKTLTYLSKFVVSGISTLEIDTLCEKFIRDNGGIAACIGFCGYKHSICISINEVVCHGVPSKNVILKDGDIVNLDVVVAVDGWHGDTSRTFYVGDVSKEKQNLVDVAFNAMWAGINVVKIDATFNDIGVAIENYVNQNSCFSVIPNYCGHGIGVNLHDKPHVLHYDSGSKIKIKPGMFFTIEPIISAGSIKSRTLSDEWTVVSVDGAATAQFEHTIGVGYDGEIHLFTKE